VDNRSHRAAAKASVAEGVAPPVKLNRIVAKGRRHVQRRVPQEDGCTGAMRGPTLIISEFCT